MIAHFNGRETCARRTAFLRARFALGTIIGVGLTISSFAADLTSPAVMTNTIGSTTNTSLPTAPPLPDLGSAAFSLFRVLGALALVLALFFAGVWLFRNWQRAVVAKGQAPKLAILETKSLGQRHAIYVVGYEQQRLLIAASPAGVTMLSQLPAATSDAATEPPAAKTSFSEMLRQAVQGPTAAKSVSSDKP